jgi:HPr kinase/phosphorylase
MIDINEKAISRKEFITVDFFFRNAQRIGKLKLYSKNHNLEKKITEQNLHRPGLVLAGFVELFSYKRVQVFGNTEIKYLNNI